ncbi:GDSL family lipase [Salinimicrobium tongyeongense]|uniref:GDSL family lipase n=1 Tax=Salinimicrobium tongyeongense TaxID=2809707 RepID=A0ABY6NNP1_9FLAO|nr:SGNH/GDSL hydrolase family protein [Salinimicrobium tongyeongense]UZH54515.1 GDSL family lipase [Salinimicrobium tongyeongense]
MRLHILFISALLLSSCKLEQEVPKDKFFEPQNENFTYSGRIQPSSEGIKLIASASSVKADVYGDTVTVFMKSDGTGHHYVAVELNEEYKGRFRITKDSLKFALPKKDSANSLAIYKETEASNGLLIFNGLRAQKIGKTSEEKRAKIEFIGDSITCGMGADTSEIDCGEGEWYDQHSAYMAYGPRVARMLNVDFEINCISGMGMYRNWNDEDQPVMPQVYPYLHLNAEQGPRAEINKEDIPDIVSIALGTNDFSMGDGKKERLPFKEESFKKNYISFIEALIEVYPETKIALISSPMTAEKEGRELIRILKDIRDEFPEKSIEVFEFEKMDAVGCTGHPGVHDHEIMAEKLLPFYRKLLNNTTHE